MTESNAAEVALVDASSTKTNYEITWNQLNKFKYYTIGAGATFTTLSLFYPFDLIKTHQQMDSGAKQMTIIRNIFQQHGMRGLYRGFGISLLGAITTENMYMTTYEMANQNYMKHTDNVFKRQFFSGLTADVVANTLVVPFDVISQRLMMTSSLETKGKANALNIIKDIMKKEGLRGFYRGYVPTMLKYAPESALWWALYGTFREVYFSVDSVRKASKEHLTRHQLISSGIAGLLSGITCAVVFNPLDVVKTRIQTMEKKSTMKEVISHLYHSEGLLKGFSKGIIPNMIFMSSTSTLSITIYEWVKILSVESNVDTQK